MLAPVNKIIAFSNVDGPGNRTSIFLQSCPFRCLYCHNPETIKMCIHCGKCVETCPVQALSIVDGKVVWDPKTCVQCDTCIKTCPNLATPKIEWLSVDQVVERVKKNRIFIRGITVSGGECMVHADFLLELFKEIKKLGLTCLIDSNGYYNFKDYPELLDICDGVMLDVKAADLQFHKELTQQSNETVLENLRYLLEMNKLEEVRTVLLPNHPEQNEKTVMTVASIIQDKTTYKLLRYRPFGVREEGLNIIGRNTASEEEAKMLCEKAIQTGAVNTKVI